MSALTVVESFMEYQASKAIWSDTRSERMLAATFLRLGDQLDAQRETNELLERSNYLQNRLCDIAIRTNEMLTDIRSSLEELLVSQQHTNELLTQSVAVQTGHFMLEKRERVLKDTLFRWSEILTNSDWVSDPHCVLIACRTLMTLLAKWKFTTEDLQDANEKRAFLDLTKRAKAAIEKSDKAVVSEVNVFQALYAEYKELTDPALLAEREAREFPPVEFDASPNIEELSALIKNRLGRAYEGEVLKCYSASLLAVFNANNPELQINTVVTLMSLDPDECGVPLVALFAQRPLSQSLRADLVVLTSKRVYEICRVAWSDQSTSSRAYTEFGDEELKGRLPALNGGDYSSDLCATIDKVTGLIKDIVEFWRRKQQASQQAAAEYDLRRKTSRQEWENALEEQWKPISVRIDEYLDLHPAVAEFYPRVSSTHQNTRIVAPHESLDIEINTATPLGGHSTEVGGGIKHRQVLDRWTRMLEEMIEPEDRVAEIALYEAALEDFEKHGVDLANLEDVEDRRRCNKVLKTARKVLRDAPDEVREELKGFKDTYDAYVQAFEQGCEPFTPGHSPPWVANGDAPQWIPGEPPPPWESLSAPEWVPGVEPQPDLLPVPDRPREVAPPGPRPSFDSLTFPGGKYANTAGNSIYNPVEILFEATDIEWLVGCGHEQAQAEALLQAAGQPFVNAQGNRGRSVDVNPDNGWPITIDNVPSVENTERRFPRGHKFGWGDSGESERWEICRAYEQALRDWAASTKAYDAYLQAVPEWEAASRQATVENERIMAQDYPNQLLAFQEAEVRRKSEWQEACKAHAINEEKRRAIWDQKCEEHRKAEARRKEDWEKECRTFTDRENRRKEQWEDACRKHEDAEKNRLNAWVVAWRAFAATVKAHGEAINAFLDEHPDVETLCGKVNAERDLTKLKQSLVPTGTDFPNDAASEPTGK